MRDHQDPPSFPTRRSSDLASSWRNRTSCTSVDLPEPETPVTTVNVPSGIRMSTPAMLCRRAPLSASQRRAGRRADGTRSEEHTSELQSHVNLVCRLLLEKK